MGKKKRRKLNNAAGEPSSGGMILPVGSVRPVLYFIVIAPLSFVVLYYFIGYPYKLYSPEIYSLMAVKLLNLFGLNVYSFETMMIGPGVNVDVIDECAGMDLIAFFTSAIVAFPGASVRQRITGLVWGIPLILIINFLRIVGLYCIGHFAPSLFETVHQYGAQTLVILLVAGLWLGWLSTLAEAEDTGDHPVPVAGYPD